MKRLLYDFMDASVERQFPRHGWAKNSQGVKLLWLPLPVSITKNLYSLGVKSNTEKSYRIANLAGHFASTLKKLTVTLRELHTLIRESCDCIGTHKDPEFLDRYLRAQHMVPLFVDLSFIYLRRLPDLLATSSRYLLFGKSGSVSDKFKNWVTDIDRYESYQPNCNYPLLRNAVKNNSEWFNDLRRSATETQKKGIGDTLEHSPVSLLVSRHASGTDRPWYKVELDSQSTDVEIRKDLLPAIYSSVNGLCELMAGFQASIDSARKYECDDSVSILGNDEDGVGFWPRIESAAS